MKETNQMIENRLKRAVESSVPNVLPKLLKQIEKQEELKKMNNLDEKDKVISLETRKSRPALRWQRILAPVAAAIILLLGSWFAYAAYATQAVIAFDVNPSIELSVNRNEKVLQVDPRNEEGKSVIDDMNLKGVDLDVAVNALIGSMVRKGYISEVRNSILITVDSKSAVQGDRLQKRLSGEVSELLNGYALQGAVLSQTSRADRHFRELAETHGISPGKAALIERLIKQNPAIHFADAARLSINDINLLISSLKAAPEGVSLTGMASRKEYIGEEKAKSIAFEHAGVTEQDIRQLEIELDYDDGRMIYEVEFYIGQIEYDYEIDAKNGRILEFKSKDKENAGTPPAQTDQYIGRGRAEEIALNHAGLSRNQVRKLETEMERDRNRMTYEVEFEHENYKYEYEIDAESGRIIEVEIEKIRAGNGQSGASPSTQRTTQREGEHIGATRAEEIALNHAGLNRNQVRKLETEMEREQNRLYYEGEFEYGDKTYEYEIDAVTGAIVKVEIEMIKPKNSHPASSSPNQDLFIGHGEAERIALNHAGLTRSQVTGFEIEFKDKKSPPYYEVEFKYGGYEYEYEIHAASGKILEFEKEID